MSAGRSFVTPRDLAVAGLNATTPVRIIADALGISERRAAKLRALARRSPLPDVEPNPPICYDPATLQRIEAYARDFGHRAP